MSSYSQNSTSFRSGDGSSILSSKVNRALEVRTDTPAMRAALEALSHLPSAESMDSRSVRVAIEQDALQQALSLQMELKSLVTLVQELRQGVSDTAQIAHRVNDAIHTTVVSAHGTEEFKSSSDNTSTTTNSMQPQSMPELMPLSNEDALEKEQQLAALLSDAFGDRDEAAQRAETVAAFLEKFDLSEHDSQLLDQYHFDDIDDGTSTEDGMHFLEALERVRAIRTELSSTFGSSTAKDLLLGSGVQSTDSRLGATSAIRMMESLALKQERAYERLYHWLQKYLHLNSVSHVPTSSGGGGGGGTSELDSDALDEALAHPFVRRSLQVLHHVPAFYSHTLELIANSRRSEETRRFLMALTAGFNGRSPIELKAHDPVAYVGDMLAFCFQSCSVEADVARGLVVIADNEDGLDDDDNLIVEDSSTMTAIDMLSHAMSGLARPLKSRVLQVVASLARRPDDADDTDGGMMDDDDEDAIARSRVSALYSICGLLIFYRSALGKSIRKLDKHTEKENPLIVSITECLAEASQAYVASVKVCGAMLDSLSLISGLSEATLVQKMLDAVGEVRVTSPGFAIEMECPSEFVAPLSMEFVAETLLEAALVLCKTLDDSVTLKLSLTTAKKAGLSTTVASQLDGRISQVEQTLIAELVKTETKEVLELCGLAGLLTAWRNMPPVEGIVMAAQPGLSADDLDVAMKEFYASLYSPPLPSFEEVKDPVLRKLARQKIAIGVVDAYEELYEAVVSDKGGYDDTSFLGHTPDQVKTLFSA